MTKTSWKSLVDWKNLSSSSMVEEETTLTIKSIQKEEIVSNNGKKEIVAVCRFADSDLPMVLNKTNMRTLESMFMTDKIEDWYGKKIVVYVQQGIKFGKELVSGLRIKPVPKRLCSVCGKVITQEMHDKTTKHYGAALCSKKCGIKAGKITEEPPQTDTEPQAEENTTENTTENTDGGNNNE